MSFKVSVGDKEYEIEFTRDSVRQFESMGGSVSNMRDTMFSATDLLFYVGLSACNPAMTRGLAKKISDEAIKEFGIIETFETMSEPFAEVFMQAGNKPAGKTLRLVPKADK